MVPAACWMLRPLSEMPEPELAVETKLLFSVKVPPVNVIGPATVMLLFREMLAVFVDLPIVIALNVVPKFQPVVLNSLVKLLLLDSMRKAPVPANVLLVGLGALF